jgi:hypothetical protein
MSKGQYAGAVSEREPRIWFVVLDSGVLQLTGSVSIRLNKVVPPGQNPRPLLPISVPPYHKATSNRLPVYPFPIYHLRTSITLRNYKLPNPPST